MAAGEGGGRGGPSVEFTPTWVAALVCTVIVLLSLVVQRIIHVHSKVSPFLSSQIFVWDGFLMRRSLYMG